MNGSCAENECTSRDENGLCDENCHGYGPNPVFAGEDEGGTCDVCMLPLVEAQRDSDPDNDSNGSDEQKG